MTQYYCVATWLSCSFSFCFLAWYDITTYSFYLLIQVVSYFLNWPPHLANHSYLDKPNPIGILWNQHIHLLQSYKLLRDILQNNVKKFRHYTSQQSKWCSQQITSAISWGWLCLWLLLCPCVFSGSIWPVYTKWCQRKQNGMRLRHNVLFWLYNGRLQSLPLAKRKVKPSFFPTHKI